MIPGERGEIIPEGILYLRRGRGNTLEGDDT